MNSKKIQSIRARINKINSSLAVMGQILLDMEIDQMVQEDRVALQKGLWNSRKPLNYPYLDKKIIDFLVRQSEDAELSQAIREDMDDYGDLGDRDPMNN